MKAAIIWYIFNDSLKIYNEEHLLHFRNLVQRDWKGVTQWSILGPNHVPCIATKASKHNPNTHLNSKLRSVELSCIKLYIVMGCQTKKRTRIILIVCGILLIIAGILGGRLMMKTLSDKVTTQTCLPTSKDSESFKTWVSHLEH